MRYALRNQDKIAAAYSEDYLREHVNASLNNFFAKTLTQKIEDTLEYQTINGKEYQVLRINDIADVRCMLEFVVIGRQYDVLRIALLGRMKG